MFSCSKPMLCKVSMAHTQLLYGSDIPVVNAPVPINTDNYCPPRPPVLLLVLSCSLLPAIASCSTADPRSTYLIFLNSRYVVLVGTRLFVDDLHDLVWHMIFVQKIVGGTSNARKSLKKNLCCFNVLNIVDFIMTCWVIVSRFAVLGTLLWHYDGLRNRLWLPE